MVFLPVPGPLGSKDSIWLVQGGNRSKAANFAVPTSHGDKVNRWYPATLGLCWVAVVPFNTLIVWDT